jgi:dihydroneopterin aldolase
LKVESSYIRLEGLHFRALHGVMPQERQVGGDFLVMLRVGYPLATAMASDDVNDTLDYAALYRLVEREMLLPSKLLEHVAGRIAEAIEKAFPQVSSIDLTLTKQNPPMGADCQGASVEVHWKK